MNENQKIVGESFWVAIGQCATAGGAIVGVRIVTEVLTPDVFGSLALLLGIVALAQNTTCAPLIQAAFRFHADMRGPREIAWLRREILGWLAGLLGFVALCFVIAAFLFGYVNEYPNTFAHEWVYVNWPLGEVLGIPILVSILWVALLAVLLLKSFYIQRA